MEDSAVRIGKTRGSIRGAEFEIRVTSWPDEICDPKTREWRAVDYSSLEAARKDIAEYGYGEVQLALVIHLPVPDIVSLRRSLEVDLLTVPADEAGYNTLVEIIHYMAA